MEQEKFSLSQEDIALSAAIEKLFPIQSLADIQATLADAQLRKPYLKSIETLTKTIHTMSKNLLDLLQENNQREADKEAEKEEQKNFLITEKEVLSSLPETEQQRIGTMRSWLQKEYGDRYEPSYKQAIMKLYNKEVVIGTDSVQFLYAHKELDKKELQLPEKGENIYYDTYTDFDDKNIRRRVIIQGFLDKDNKDYYYIQEAQEKLKQQNKYIATEENTFAAILGGFVGTDEQKIKAMQFLTGFVGRGIVSLEKDKNGCRRILGSVCYRIHTGMFDGEDRKNNGCLLVAKDC